MTLTYNLLTLNFCTLGGVWSNKYSISYKHPKDWNGHTHRHTETKTRRTTGELLYRIKIQNEKKKRTSKHRVTNVRTHKNRHTQTQTHRPTGELLYRIKIHNKKTNKQT